MIEVLWHGRGGQGAFTAARLLGAAAMEAGLRSLAFPSFGPERRGAPMRAFTKMAQEPIGDRSPSVQADYVVYLDETLLPTDWETELKPSGCVLVNSTRTFADPRILALDADGLSAAVFGRPIPNTVFLGALARLEDAVALANVEEAVRSSMAPRLHEPNCAIAREAYQAVDALLAEQRETARTASAQDNAAENVCRSNEPNGATSNGACSDGASAQVFDVVRHETHIPRLRNQLPNPNSLNPADYARTTCFTAGHLVTKNAGWRSQRPVVNTAACTGCGQCVTYCPDGALYFGSADANAAAAACTANSSPHSDTSATPLPGESARQSVAIVDTDFCKGCGICAKMCRFNAIDMVPESEVAA